MLRQHVPHSFLQSFHGIHHNCKQCACKSYHCHRTKKLKNIKQPTTITNNNKTTVINLPGIRWKSNLGRKYNLYNHGSNIVTFTHQYFLWGLWVCWGLCTWWSYLIALQSKAQNSLRYHGTWWSPDKLTPLKESCAIGPFIARPMLRANLLSMKTCYFCCAWALHSVLVYNKWISQWELGFTPRITWSIRSAF